MDDLRFIEIVVEYMKQHGVISDLEKDIVNTIAVYTKRPFERNSAEQKIRENNARYPDVLVMIKAVPGIETKPFDEVSDMDVLHNLYMQIRAMCMKSPEIKALFE